MTTIAEARQEIADALSAIDTLNVQPKPIRNPRANDGWVIVSRMTPSRFGGVHMATFLVVIMLSADEVTAEARLDELSSDVLNATADLNTTDVVLEPAEVMVGQQSTPLYALTLTLSMEVS